MENWYEKTRAKKEHIFQAINRQCFLIQQKPQQLEPLEI